METAKAFGYRWGDWLVEHPRLRAQMMAHELVKGMRDAYLIEQRQAVAEKRPNPKQPAVWDTIRSRFFR